MRLKKLELIIVNCGTYLQLSLIKYFDNWMFKFRSS